MWGFLTCRQRPARSRPPNRLYPSPSCCSSSLPRQAAAAPVPRAGSLAQPTQPELRLSFALPQAKHSLPTMSPMDYSLVLWSLGSLGHRDIDLINPILDRATGQLQSLKPQDISHLVLSCARLGIGPAQHLDLLGKICRWCYRLAGPPPPVLATWDASGARGRSASTAAWLQGGGTILPVPGPRR